MLIDVIDIVTNDDKNKLVEGKRDFTYLNSIININQMFPCKVYRLICLKQSFKYLHIQYL